MSDIKLPLWLTAILAANKLRPRDIAMCALDSATPMCDYTSAHVSFIDGSYIKLQVYNRTKRPDLSSVPRGTGPKTMLERVADGEFAGQTIAFPSSPRHGEKDLLTVHGEREVRHDVALSMGARIDGNQKTTTREKSYENYEDYLKRTKGHF